MGGVESQRIVQIIRDLGLRDDELSAWRETCLSEEHFDAWITDRVARRPSGPGAKEVYGSEDVHDFARRALLSTLALGPGDHLLEIGCGGGLLLRDALATGAVVTGLDHSTDMAEIAKVAAPAARLVVAKAESLPFAESRFTGVAMSIVFLFFDDPLAVLRECRRVMQPGAKLAVYTNGPELVGTPAAPEPIASLAHFYEDAELARLAEEVPFADVAVSKDQGAQLLTARKP